MNHNFADIEEILSQHVSGFHTYCLQEPVHLTYVSENFYHMTGYTSQELLSQETDLYAALIHPGDKTLYCDFMEKFTQAGQSCTAQYRILKKDGTVLYVNDTITTKRLADGTLAGYSVLTDITPLKTENDNLRFLNETIPCGFMKYTCEKYPKLTYINEQMLKMLGFPENDEVASEGLELYKENIYLMVPIEERRKFSIFLEQVHAKGAPVSGELTVLRFDGTKARLYGWVIKCVNAQGQEEFQSVCMDITERYNMKRKNQTARYLKALTEVYDRIFECDRLNKTVKYLYGPETDIFHKTRNIPMHFEEATVQWIQNTVLKEDREKVRGFLESFFKRNASQIEGQPPQIQFRVVDIEGEILLYTGIFLKTDSDTGLFCCRGMTQQQMTDSLRNENVSLRNINENMQELVMRFTDGLVAFEVEDNYVKPLYASDNVCHFFGYTKEEWLPLTQTRHSLKKFVSKSNVAYEDFKKLLKEGEAEFTYVDIRTNTPQRIKAVCSQRGAGDSAPRYVMLYKLNESKPQASEPTNKTQIYIRTFGYFDVFVDEKPIAFRNKKSKELFALLVDRRGGFISSEEVIGYLWEDEDVNAVTLARYRKVALRLKNILEEYGIADIIESVDGKRRIVTDKVRCDLYDYLSQKEEYAQLFKGSYLTNYSWGEMTLGELLHQGY